MNRQDPVEELEQKLDELIELRKKEEEEYGNLLTLLDQHCQFPLPNELSSRLLEIKDSLNRSWDVSKHAYYAAQQEDRSFWKEVARNSIQYLEPFVQQQREFNSLVVHLLNEFIESAALSLSRIREFQISLILYFQKIIPIVDSKFREMVGAEDKNVLVNLQNFEKHLTKLHTQIQKAAKSHTDLLFQELDKRMETLQVDSQEQQNLLSTFQVTVRSLHHLANSLEKSDAKSAPENIQSRDESRYFHFEEYFRGSREEIKEKFRDYVKYFQTRMDVPVLDLGCGRGEFLELMKEASIPALGVDSNGEMVKKCREMGLNVSQGDLLSFLESQEENSLGGIFCAQVVEHLPADMFLKLLQISYSRLKPGVPILLETVNIGSAFAFLQVYTKDLTHRTPVHPDTLKFLVSACGFQKPEVLFMTPVPAMARLKMFNDPSDEAKKLIDQNMAKLNQLLYDSQEYAVLAYK